jgi:hypothetical protein
LDYDKVIRAVDIFAVPEFAALRSCTIQIDGARVRLPMARTYNLRNPASSDFPIYGIRNYVLKVVVAVAGCRPNALVLLGDNLISHR